jgi:MFS family permease
MSWTAKCTINAAPERIFAAEGVASGRSSRHLRQVTGPRHSPLDEPRTSAHAWGRYKRLMRGMALFTLGVIVLALAVLYALGALVSVHFVVATVLGIGLTMMLMSALMGLVFLSSGTGHDESVSDLTDRNQD